MKDDSFEPDVSRYGDDVDADGVEAAKTYEEFDKLTLMELITEFDKIPIEQDANRDILAGVISDRLNVPTIRNTEASDYNLYNGLRARRRIADDLEKRIRELETKFTNHRHSLEKPYSEKPVY